MTKKDYELIARVFNANANATDEKTTTKLYTAQVVSASLAKQFCAVFKRTNPRFDESKFLTACGIKK